MLSQAQVLATILGDPKDPQGGRKARCFDSRDYMRLSQFFPISDWDVFGMKLAEGKKAEDYTPRPWTEEEVKKQLEQDVAFGFEKALDQRGISAGFMYEVVKMWMWVLEDELQHMTEYAQYGLPLFKAVAIKYGFKDEIDGRDGDDDDFASRDY